MFQAFSPRALSSALFGVLILGCGFAAAAQAAPPPPAEVYAAPAQVRLAALSPSGRYIAVVSQQNNLDVLRVYDADDLKGGWKAQANVMELANVRWLQWKGDDRIVFSEIMPAFFGSSAGGRMVQKTQLYSIDRQLKKFINLSARPKNWTEQPNIQDDVVSFLPGDPNHILVSIDWRSPIYPAVRKVDVRDGSSDILQDRDSRVLGWVADDAGVPRLAYGDPTKKGPGLYRVGAKGALTPFEPKGTGDTFQVLGFDRTPDRLVVLSDHEGGTAGLYVYDLGKDAFTERLFKDPAHDVDDVVWSFDHSTVAGAEYDVDVSQQSIIDPAYRKTLDDVEAIVGKKGLAVLSATPDGRRLVVASEESGRPVETWWVDLAAHEARPFVRANPALDAAQMAKVEAVTFKARDGVDIPGYVTLPVGVARLADLKGAPFVLMPHGGPQSRADADFDFETQFIASRGYAVFEPNFRGSSGYGAAFQAAGRRAWGEVVQDDLADAAGWLTAQGYADKDRMCVAGWSFGGYAALMASIRHAPLFKCAVSVAGPSDLELLIQNDAVYYGGDHEAQILIGRAWKDRARLHEDSPVLHASEVGPPVLLVHGRADWTVLVDHSRFMDTALKGAGKKVDYLELPLANHSLSREADRLAYLKALDAFLAANLGPGQGVSK
jgi:dipeptidyl aminopeptidase/acylaminoacyl peptidase